MLIYGLCDEDINILSEVVQKNKFNGYKIISKAMAGMKIKDILKENNKQQEGINLKEKVILFNNFNQKDLYLAIDEIHDNMDKSIILASVTPVSINWTFSYLLEHLIEEREWIKNQHTK